MMKVFGFTSDKLAVPVELAESEIISNRIHPWWVDLFDPDPIVKEVGGRTLYFTRLRDIVFVVPSPKPGMMVRVLIGVLKDSEFSFFFGIRRDGWEVSVLPPDEETITFEEAFTSFLEWMKDKDVSNLGEGEYSLLSQRELVITSGALYLKLHRSMKASEWLPVLIDGHSYNGEMFAGVSVHRQMPRRFTWVFRRFGDLNPVIFGGSLRNLLLGVPEKDIDFIVDEREFKEMSERLTKARVTQIRDFSETDRYGRRFGHPVFEFSHGGTKYHLVCRGNFLADNHWLANDFSVNQLMAATPHEVIASRIALWDLGNREARLTSRLKVGHSGRSGDISQLLASWPERTRRLSEKGFTILPNPFKEKGKDESPPEDGTFSHEDDETPFGTPIPKEEESLLEKVKRVLGGGKKGKGRKTAGRKK